MFRSTYSTKIHQRGDRTQAELTHSGNVQVFVLLRSLLIYLARIQQHLDMLTPFIPKLIGTRQTSVTTTNDQRINPMFEQVMHGFRPSFKLSKFFTSRCPDQCSSCTQESTNIVPAYLDDVSAFQRDFAFTIFEQFTLAVCR